MGNRIKKEKTQNKINDQDMLNRIRNENLRHLLY